MVLATSNRGKAAEFQALLGPAWEVLLQSDCGVKPAAETGRSFLENALLKARHAASATGLAALADDSGLEVDALGGAPGIRSARYAGENATDAQNLQRLLAELAGVAAGQRGARFRCALAYVRHGTDAQPVIAEAAWEGHIAEVSRGSSGFGYDPVFVEPQSGRTAAELTAAEKNRLSHRGQALRLLCQRLAAEPAWPAP